MAKTANIKIDQLRINIPYDFEDTSLCRADSPNKMYFPKHVDLVDQIFHFSWIFKVVRESYGHNGYTNAYIFGEDNGKGKISIMWNENRKDMGISVDFTATGKDLYETLGKLYGLEVDWQQIINEVCDTFQGHISRIDIAVDLINYGFSVDEIYRNLMTGQYSFLNKIDNRISMKYLKIIGKIGEIETLNVGSRSSDGYLRIYNKKIEQSRSNGLYRNIALNCEDWIRVEGEFKHRLAKEIGKYIASLEVENMYPYLLGCILERWKLIKNDKREGKKQKK